MKLTFLRTAEPGLTWFRRYHIDNPQLNRSRALAAFRRAHENLRENPWSGHPFEDMDRVREYSISGTAFSLLYTVANDTVWIIDVRDTRGLRSADALNRFQQELRQRLYP